MNPKEEETQNKLKEVFMKAGKIWGETELVHKKVFWSFIESVLNQDTNALNIITNTNGTDFFVKVGKCLSECGRMINLI